MQEAYYDYTYPDKNVQAKGKETYLRYYKEYKTRIDALNKKAEDEAGFLDAFVQNVLPSSISKPYQKYGLGDQPETMDYTLPKFESYAEKKNREKESYLTSKHITEISTDNNNRWKVRASASNTDPLKVAVYGNRGEREKNPISINAKGTLMHFLDQSPSTGYLYPGMENIINVTKPNEYIGNLTPTHPNSNEYKLTYITKKEFLKLNKPYGKDNFYLRQVKFDDIDFNQKVTDTNFSGHTYWGMKTSDQLLPISSGKNAEVYNYSSGQSVVFIFPYKGDIRYTHFTGSPSEIKAEGNKIKSDYKLKNRELTIGVADAGSYSSNIKAQNGVINNSLLNSKDFGYYNKNSYTGAGMALIN